MNPIYHQYDEIIWLYDGYIMVMVNGFNHCLKITRDPKKIRLINTIKPLLTMVILPRLNQLIKAVNGSHRIHVWNIYLHWDYFKLL